MQRPTQLLPVISCPVALDLTLHLLLRQSHTAIDKAVDTRQGGGRNIEEDPPLRGIGVSLAMRQRSRSEEMPLSSELPPARSTNRPGNVRF